MRSQKQALPVAFEEGTAFSRETEWGNMNIAYETWPAGMDATPLFKGLPDDRCQCPHWGYLLKGRIRIKYNDHEEVINAGDLYYLAPGHIPVIEETAELVEFSPKGEYQNTMAVVGRNMATTEKAA